MKRFLLILLILIAVTAIGVGIFIASIDWDSIKEHVVQKIETQLGRNIEVGDVGFSFNGQLNMQFRDISVQDDPGFQTDSVVEIGRLDVSIGLEPLLKKKIEVREIVLNKLVLTIIRNENNQLNVETFSKTENQKTVASSAKSDVVKANPQSVSGPSQVVQSIDQKPSNSAPAQFSVSKVSVQDGMVRFIDKKKEIPRPIEIKDIDIEANFLSLLGPVSIKGKADLFGLHGQNLTFDTKVDLTGSKNKQSAINVNVELDPISINWSEIKKLNPQLIALPFSNGAIQNGRIQISMNGLENPDTMNADVSLTNLKVKLDTIETPLDRGFILLNYADGKLVTKKASLNLGEGKVELDLTVHNLQRKPFGNGWVRLQEIDLTKFQKATSSTDPYVTGMLNGMIQFELRRNPQVGMEPFAHGQLNIQNGMVYNLNIPRVVLEKVTVIPGLGMALISSTSPSVKEMFNRKDTQFDQLSADFSFQGQTLNLTRVISTAQDYGANVQGNVIVAQRYVQLQGILYLTQQPSVEIVDKIKELRCLQDQNQQIVIPFTARGTSPKIVPVPDLIQITKQIAICKGREQIGKALQKAVTGESPTDGSITGSNVEDLIKSFL